MAEHDPRIVDDHSAAIANTTCSLIRELYFIGRMPLREIAMLIGVSMRAVRGALVLRGGKVGAGPTPSASASGDRARLVLVTPTVPAAVGPIVRRRPTRGHP